MSSRTIFVVINEENVSAFIDEVKKLDDSITVEKSPTRQLEWWELMLHIPVAAAGHALYEQLKAIVNRYKKNVQMVNGLPPDGAVPDVTPDGTGEPSAP